MNADLLERLTVREENTERIVFSFADTEFNEGKLVGDFGEVGFTENGLESFVSELDIPKPYFKRMPSALRKMNVDYWLQKMTGQSAALVTEGKIRTFMNPKYPYVPSSRILQAVETEVDNGYVANYKVSDDFVELVMFGPNFDTLVNDSPVRAGIRFLFSDSWKKAPRFDAELCRIACFNSAIAPIISDKFVVSGKTEIELIESSRGLVRASLDKIPEMLAGFRILENDKVDNYLAYIKTVCRANNLPDKVYRAIVETAGLPEFLATVSNSRISNMYDVVNLITYVASHNLSLTDAQRETLFHIGGNLMLENNHLCGSCGSKVV